MSQGKMHIIGIGGTAMVAGARLAIEAGWEVRGSDQPLYPPTSEMVAALGVPCYSGYAAENLDWGPDLVVIGNALSRGNPEVEAVLSRRLRYVSLPEWLKEHVLLPRRPVVVCGTHGKTTTTAMTAHVLAGCGLSPGYFIGGQPLGLPHSAFLGAPGAPFVIEGDEYDTAFFDKRAKFFHYVPEIAIVTSVEFDHGDIYADLAAIELAFQRMLRQIPREGHLIACADNAAVGLRGHAPCHVASYGFSADADWRGEHMGQDAGLPLLRVHHGGAVWGELRCPMAGTHNLQNALAAVVAASVLGAGPESIASALATFAGVRRRMEVFLETKGVTFVDDFAHHPTAIRETIAAARMRWPGRRLRVAFEPRSNTTVTRRFQGELGEALRGADEVFLGPIHRAESIAEEERLDRDLLVAGLRAVGTSAHACADARAIVAAIAAEHAAGDVILILSNGAFGGIYAQCREAFAII